jgi:Na+-transporting methylmalonyl-CoA/oxaloacetate decarboxylase gamma subunit
MEGLGVIFVVAMILVAVLVMRWIGAWMLRIDEVINIQKEILQELKKRN